eukprot:COSAG01_NODE_3672_length_5809_cov_4.250263_3_plen_550_part_00
MPVPEPHWGTGNCTSAGFSGAFCLCVGARTFHPTRRGAAAGWGYCQPAAHVPEQINLQLAGPGTLVVSFVTFPTNKSQNGLRMHAVAPPQAEFWLASPSDGQKRDIVTSNGVTRAWNTPKVDYALQMSKNPRYNATEIVQPVRTYALHFVRLSQLRHGERYCYRVRAGGATWSNTFRFTAPASTMLEQQALGLRRPTRLAVFGDMGVFRWNNMFNLAQRAERGMLDALVHIGDHAYNLMQNDDRRGDGYLNAYQPILTQVPWMPIVGNHEYYDGGHFMRFLTQMGGVTMGQTHSSDHVDHTHSEWQSPSHHRHSATSSLGLLLAAGGALGLGSHGATVPSNTSRFFSVDVGLFHLVAIDQNIYWEQKSEQIYRAAQLSWLERDLALANQNRRFVPWLVVLGHIPIYCALCSLKNVTMNERAGGWWAKHELEPLLLQHGVDFFIAGHAHMYESLFPCKGNAASQHNFIEPHAPIHILSGNAGPGSHHVFAGRKTPMTRFQSEEFGYGILEASNDSVATYYQRANEDDRVIDSFVVKRSSSESPRTFNADK